MFFKVSILVVVICVQASLVFSQQPQIYASQGAQKWDPYSWAAPYYTAANTAWNDYIQKSQQASQQLNNQWGQTGAGDMMAKGMDYAKQAQKIAEEAMKIAAKEAMKYAMMG